MAYPHKKEKINKTLDLLASAGDFEVEWTAT
jgi:hypothetical protein